MAANRVRALRGISIALVVFVMLTFSAELKKASAASDRKQLATNRLRSASRTPQPAGS